MSAPVGAHLRLAARQSTPSESSPERGPSRYNTSANSGSTSLHYVSWASLHRQRLIAYLSERTFGSMLVSWCNSKLFSAWNDFLGSSIPPQWPNCHRQPCRGYAHIQRPEMERRVTEMGNPTPRIPAIELCAVPFPDTAP